MSSIGEAVVDLIRSSGVEVVDKGANVKRGEVNIRCPFCGNADPSHHLGINPVSGYWACWRNSDHRGKSPVRLLTALLGEPSWKIRQSLGLRTAPALDTFSGVRDRLLKRGPEVEAQTATKLDLNLAELRDIADGKQAAQPFIRYLNGRGLQGDALTQCADMYGLLYSIKGDFKDRVILPYFFRGDLVTITGRSIHPDAQIRYRDLEPDKSLLDTSSTLFNYDRAARGGRMLVCVEGPFDALKGDYAGSQLGVHVVGLSTNSITDDQVLMLCDLADAFDHVVMCMDTPSRFGLIDSHKMVGRVRGVLECGVLDASRLGKDLGGASLREIATLFKEEIKRHEL